MSAPILTAENIWGLPRTELLAVCPSAGAKQAHKSRSPNFGFVSSENLLDELETIGFYPTFVVQGRTKLVDRRPFTKHIIRLRAEHYLGLETDVPDIVFTNNSDGTGAYTLFFGYIRYICGNMLIFGDYRTMLRIPHRKNIVERVVEGTLQLARMSGQIIEEINIMKQIQLSREEQLLLAEHALMARFGWEQEDTEEANGPDLRLLPTVYTAEDFLTPRRPQDEGDPSLWMTYQLLEENATKGGVEREDASGKRHVTRRIKSPSGMVNTESLLYSLTKRFMELKS